MSVRLKKISSLKNLRNFIDFNSSHELKRHEVFYAPNGSGKTNLTRILSALQAGTTLDKLKSKEAGKTGNVPELSIMIDSSVITQSNYTDKTNVELLNSLIIFNSDYISDQITIPDFKKDLDGDLTLELGKPDSDIKKLENKIIKEKNTIKDCVERLENRIITYTDGLRGKIYKANEQNIWSELMLDRVLSISKIDKGTSYVNSDVKERIARTDYSKTSKERHELLALEGAEKIGLTYPKIFKPDLEKIAKALTSTDKFPLNDEDISNNVKFLSVLLQDYLAFGKEPHIVIGTAITKSEEKNKCILCKRTLDDSTKDLFNRYKDFFEGEKAKFEELLRKYIQEIKVLIASIELVSNDKKERVNQLAELFGLNGRWTDINTSKLLGTLGHLKTTLEEKQQDLSSAKQSKGIDDISPQLEKLMTVLESNKKVADALDVKSNDVATNLANVRRRIGQMELVNFINQNIADFDSIDSSNANIKALNIELHKKLAQAPTKSIREATSKLFNFFMSDRVGIDKYQSEIINNQMVIKLKEFDISNSTHLISDGEQTIIGLAYFLASSISKLSDYNKFSNAVFIIDDPVSSVCYTNLFGISSLLKKFQSDIKQELWKQNRNDLSIQTIVLTHNIQFFNIMKTHVWKDNKVKKHHYGIIDSESIRDIKQGRLLSEFQSALLSIYKESRGSDGGLNVCNDIRRIAETLRHFYGIKEDFTADSMKKVFPYINSKNFDNLFIVINHFSHGSPEDFDILPPNIVDSAVTEFVEIIEDEQSPFIDLWNEIKAMEVAT